METFCLTKHILFSSFCETFFFFIRKIYLLGLQTFIDQTVALPIFLWIVSSPSGPRLLHPFPLAQDGYEHPGLDCLSVFMSSVAFCVYTVIFAFVLLICFMSIWLLDQPTQLEGRKGNIFLPYKMMLHESFSVFPAQGFILQTQSKFLLICEASHVSSRLS